MIDRASADSDRDGGINDNNIIGSEPYGVLGRRKQASPHRHHRNSNLTASWESYPTYFPPSSSVYNYT